MTNPLDMLSVRERQVLQMVADGQTSKQIAAKLNIAAATVDSYRRRIMLKLDVDSVAGLVRFAIHHGLA